MIELSTSGNEIKTMYFKVAEQEFVLFKLKTRSNITKMRS